uniref:BPTI/Kunitz inhibitor domain-containing protein n=1 Tax=Haemonchus contortus TaxID=6289 RepID=A0A7I4YUD0_HAECO
LPALPVGEVHQSSFLSKEEFIKSVYTVSGLKMESFLRRLAVFGLFFSYIGCQHYSRHAHDSEKDFIGELFDDYPSRLASSLSSGYSNRRPHSLHNRRDHDNDYPHGSQDCHSCRGIGNACSTSAPEDHVQCARPSVVYTAVKCLYANIKCEYAEHYNVRLETDSGHVLEIGEQSETLAECINGRWMTDGLRSTDVVFKNLRCIPTEGLESIRRCNFPVDMGDKNCDHRASIKYHFDAETMTCLPFKYTGCGGNANNFYSKLECTNECLPMDHLKCPANSPPALRSDGSSDCDKEKRKCPEGSSCKMEFAVGICCDDKNLEKYIANMRPDCGDRKVVMDGDGTFDTIMLGKSCDHQFCPLGAECRRGAYFAYCCQ